jgi:hypothetical protein
MPGKRLPYRATASICHSDHSVISDHCVRYLPSGLDDGLEMTATRQQLPAQQQTEQTSTS